jgi:hypothetical protein
MLAAASTPLLYTRRGEKGDKGQTAVQAQEGSQLGGITDTTHACSKEGLFSESSVRGEEKGTSEVNSSKPILLLSTFPNSYPTITMFPLK